MEHSPSSTTDSSPGDDRESLLFSALVGAVASIVLSPLPGSTVLGGAISGYLTGSDRELGVKSGAVSGLFVSLVGVVLGVVVLGFFSIFAIGVNPRGFGLGILGIAIVALFGLALLLVYTVGLGALGGYLGAYLHEEFA
ncbi:hypothetical protein C5B91_09585 [Haloferax sp. Atlit-10N]|uniref:DUF5518 domain-containing protein n=1 Tax=Haloferax prahovense (strain DSM 18310 / JCM 13924 / TL6) TaxID=1227461 RepID=M0G1I1_HALPT|nr:MULTISPECIES: DUF5518 domain-containing protein [Haloferax]ELZ66131.1 hypothetical protein C457_15185 [Haloferax prahovense DSM 18310]RDZ44776.1 hypothetical protein C5B87_11385 [Haloferax sp. Atlit-16N]RDZ48126.1 hypothetical protein C5B86_03440 [Haloferax sp. Atlit-19N]RDZ59444.1 hypothetical protein C5B91_09585 [Haloferax sp. Atlit-10N]